MRTIFIGDVHGCLTELQALLLKVDPRRGDRLIFVGDIVDKGPRSLQTLHYIRVLLPNLPGSVVVSGNHDEKASRQWKRGIAVAPWCEEATAGDWAFIDSMPLTWHDPALGVRVVHGGIFPALLNNHPDVFEKIEARGDKWRKGGGKVMNRARRMLRIRYVGGAVRMETGEKPGPGDMLELGTNREGDPFWADVYDGSQGFVVYGHDPQWETGKPRWNSDAVGIDTGCVFGGKLTALVMEPDSAVCCRPGGSPVVGFAPYRIVSVDAEKRYAEPLEDD